MFYDIRMNLIIINGLPASGKTTIAKPLSTKLGIPLIAKDTIKEFLFDNLGINDREWSRTLGKVSNDFVYTLAETMMAAGQSVMIENAFERSFAQPRLQELIGRYQPNVIEIYCSTDFETRKQRFIGRNESGERHIGHADRENYLENAAPEDPDKYAALQIGKVINIDTPKRVEIDEIVRIIGLEN